MGMDLGEAEIGAEWWVCAVMSVCSCAERCCNVKKAVRRRLCVAHPAPVPPAWPPPCPSPGPQLPCPPPRCRLLPGQPPLQLLQQQPSLASKVSRLQHLSLW